jgi:hypothetical protein
MTRIRSLVVVLAVTSVACTSYTSVSSPAEARDADVVRVEGPDHRRVFIGHPTQAELTDIFKWALNVEVEKPSDGKTAALVVGLVLGAGLLVALGFAFANWHPRF